jgi:hypothetical protein
MEAPPLSLRRLHLVLRRLCPPPASAAAPSAPASPLLSLLCAVAPLHRALRQQFDQN